MNAEFRTVMTIEPLRSVLSFASLDTEVAQALHELLTMREVSEQTFLKERYPSCRTGSRRFLFEIAHLDGNPRSADAVVIARAVVAADKWML